MCDIISKVAPYCKIIVSQALNNRVGDYAGLIRAIDNVKNDEFDIVNFSLSTKENKQIVKDKIDLYQQIYFTHDEPIPFKGDLFIYPVLVKDYYQFYSLIDIFTVEKNEDKTGIGIAMTNLDYLIHMTKSDYPNHEIVIRKIISMFVRMILL